MKKICSKYLIKFKLQYNDTIKSLQFQNQVRQQNESAEQWMGRNRTEDVECNYKAVDRQLKEQFMHALNDSEMLAEITRELSKSDWNVIIPSECVLISATRVEVQRAQAADINSLHELKNFYAILKWTKANRDRQNQPHL